VGHAMKRSDSAPRHREPGLADQLPWPEDGYASVVTERAKLGGEDFNPEGSTWLKPFAVCPHCSTPIVGWTDKALIEKIKKHCRETGCKPPDLEVYWKDCIMCHGTKVYPYHPRVDGVVVTKWHTCAACNGSGKEPS
jgi:hypothetical protein